jgi:LysM repeat protein
MKTIKRSAILMICCFTTMLNAQAPIYLEIGDCVKEMHYKYTNNEGTASEYFDYQFALNDYETVSLTASKYSMTDLNFDAIRTYQITACGSNALKTQLSAETIAKIQKGEQDVFLLKRTANGYKVGKANNATYSVYLPEDKYLRVIAADFRFDFDGNETYEPGAELKTGGGEESFIFYTQQDERCYHKPTFMHVPTNFLETVNLEYILGIGMVRKYSDESETRLIAINGQNFDTYLTTFCKETPVAFNLEMPKIEQPSKNEINMNLVDKSAESWINAEGETAKGGNITIYKSTPVAKAIVENNRIEKTRTMNYEYLESSNIETVNMGTENTARGVAEPLQQPLNEKYHVVNQGETLYSISKKYNLSTLDIKALNNLEDNIIGIGQQLRIKP